MEKDYAEDWAAQTAFGTPELRQRAVRELGPVWRGTKSDFREVLEALADENSGMMDPRVWGEEQRVTRQRYTRELIEAGFPANKIGSGMRAFGGLKIVL